MTSVATSKSSDILIADRRIGAGHPCFIIAEIGVNHNGDVDTALAMIDAIAAAGADCVKFQTFNTEEFCKDATETYEYISQGKVVKESMFSMFKRLELEYGEFAKLFERARQLGLIALSTPTDIPAVDLLESLGAPAFKIGSDDLVHTPFIEYVARKQRPMIISTGMASMDDVDRAVNTIRQTGNEQIILLHCVSEYPAPLENLNLRKITTLGERFDIPVGFSDHSEGVIGAGAAVAIGACVLEKHFTLDRGMAGPDHRFSADPQVLKSLVTHVRDVEQSLGQPSFVPTKGEVEMAALARRSIVAAHDLHVGHVIARDDLSYRRPGTGLMPYETSRIVGLRTNKTILAGQQISGNDLDKS